MSFTILIPLATAFAFGMTAERMEAKSLSGYRDDRRRYFIYSFLTKSIGLRRGNCSQSPSDYCASRTKQTRQLLRQGCS